MIDHILIGAPELSMGIDYVFEKTKFLAAAGGKHPQWNTQNALLSLGVEVYLEIISPIPGLNPRPPFQILSSLDRPKPITWAVKTRDIQGTADLLNRLKLGHSGIVAGTRLKTDGSQLNWMLMFPENNYGGIIPFFIEWDNKSIHPALTAPKGLRLNRLDLYHPDPELILNLLESLGLDCRCNFSDEIRLELFIQDDLGVYKL